MLRTTTFLLLVTTASTLEAQPTSEQRAAREGPPLGRPIWVEVGGDLSTPLHPREYVIREAKARASRRAPGIQDRWPAASMPAVTREHWMSIAAVDASPGAVGRPGHRTFTLPAGQQLTLSISPRRASPGTGAVVVLQVDGEDGTPVWSTAARSTVDATRRLTVLLPGLERGAYVLTVEVYSTQDPEVPESRSVNPLRID
jgi:hypothetical protein